MTKPRINSPSVFGVRPDRPLRYRVAASGSQPIALHADNLPGGVSFDPTTGLITGKLNEVGEHVIRIAAENDFGICEKDLTIKVGARIGLTPAMGWNSWNCFAEEVSQENVLATARAMAKHLAPYGWEYVNIDGCWQADARGGAHGAILPHAERFPDMKSLCDEVHELGLKVGIYSTPWVADYGGNIGGSGHTPDGSGWKRKIDGGNWMEQWPKLIREHYHGPYKFDYHDAAQWAEWGIDYLKYDWSPNDLDSIFRMWRALDLSGRDVIFSLSNNCPRSIAQDVGVYANSWRTTGDLHDVWESDGLPQTGQVQGLLNVWQQHHFWQPYTGPGHFADPDMLVVGEVRWGETGRTRLSEVEQYTHINLWTLFASPLLIGTPLDTLDPFTLGLLTNEDVIEVNQDPLGIQGVPIIHEVDREVIVKRLVEGKFAVGLFNKSDSSLTVDVAMDQLQIEGEWEVQDLWSKETGPIGREGIGAHLEAHESKIYRLTKR